MSLYKLGLDAGAKWLPSAAEPLRNQAGEIIAGVSMMRQGGARMYAVGALEEQPKLAPGMDGVVQWAEDAGMGVLLFIGLFVTVAAASSGKERK